MNLRQKFIWNIVLTLSVIILAWNSYSQFQTHTKVQKAYKKFKNTRLPRKKYARAQDVIPVVEFLISKKSHMLSGTDVVTDFSESNSFRI